ncbi:hypothetical protein MXB_1069 [Myxobolus squamalis]|nr:hypothetical protein MXB_1069 [Myxobolus squamalis]
MDVIELISNLSKKDCQLFSIYIYGRFLEENSFYFKFLLSQSNTKFSTINCAECFSENDIYTSMAYCVKNKKEIKMNDSLPNCIESLKNILNLSNRKGSIVILFDRFHHFAAKIPDMRLSYIFKLHEYLSPRILCIFLSALPFESINNTIEGVYSHSFHFPIPHMDDMASYVSIKLNRPSFNKECFYFFCQNILNIFYPILNNLSKVIEHSISLIDKFLLEDSDSFTNLKVLKRQLYMIGSKPCKSLPIPLNFSLNEQTGKVKHGRYLVFDIFMK